MLLAGAHEALDGDDRRFHDTQLAVAGQEGAAAQQEGHGARHLGRSVRAARAPRSPRSAHALRDKRFL